MCPLLHSSNNIALTGLASLSGHAEDTGESKEQEQEHEHEQAASLRPLVTNYFVPRSLLKRTTKMLDQLKRWQEVAKHGGEEHTTLGDTGRDSGWDREGQGG